MSLKVIFSSLVLVLLLLFRFHSFYQVQPIYVTGEDVSFVFTLSEEPDFSNSGQRFSIKTSANQIISVKASPFPRFHNGEVLKISGSLEEKELDKGKKILLMHYPKLIVIKESDNFISQAAKNVREKNISLFERTLPPTSASLMAGIVFGSKERFSTDFKQHLSTTGVMHVIAASGMNITFVSGALMYSLGFLLKRRYALLVGIVGILFYVFLVGFQPSIVRASVMAIFAFGAGIFGRQNLALFSLFLTSYLMLLWQPQFLFDVGFQLSVMATLGILVIGRVEGLLGLEKLGLAPRSLVEVGGVGKIIEESVLTTSAAQLATLPILLGVFGSFGILSLLVNALVLWTIPLLMTLGSLAVLTSFIMPFAQFLLLLSLPFLLFFEAIVTFFGELGWNVIVESFPWPLTVGYYLLLTAVLWFLKTKKATN